MAKDDVKVQDGEVREDSVEDLIPTDEELSAAFDAAESDSEQVTEQGVDETVSVEAEPTSEGSEDEEVEADDDLEDQKDRSRMGRRMKRLEGTLEQLLTRMEKDAQQRQVREYYEAQQLLQRRPERDHDEPNFESDIVTTETDVERVIDKKERRKVEESERYQNGFVATLHDLAGSNQKMHKVIVQELITNFNRKVTGDPKIDARLNYAEAKAAVAFKYAATKGADKARPNVAGGTQAATGVSASSTAQKSGKADIWSRLDPEAAAYAKAVKMSEEDIEAALAGETPMNLRHSKRMG
jgi:hypothetical protein